MRSSCSRSVQRVLASPTSGLNVYPPCERQALLLRLNRRTCTVAGLEIIDGGRNQGVWGTEVP